MEAFIEIGIVTEQNTGRSAIYIRTTTPDRHVFDSDEAKVMVMQLARFISEVDELNAKLEITNTLQ